VALSNLADNTPAVFLAKLENGSPEWLTLRGTGIGGSEVGTILGLNPWESPFTLWAKKTARIDAQIPTNEAMEWGNRLEPVVLDKFAENHPEFEVLRDVGTWHHKDRPWHVANPDAVYREGDTFGIIEVKTAQYEDAWADGVPRHYEAQVQHYLDAFGFSAAFVVVLFHGNRYREYEVLADPNAQAEALEKVTAFREYVANDIKPEFDGALSTYQTVRAINPLIEDAEVELGWLGVDYFAAEAVAKEAEAEVLKLKSLILDALGTAKRGLVEGEWVLSRQARGAGDPYLVTKRG
jgi:putative phage-type endonuclease